MDNISSIYTELAFHGIRINENGECLSFMEGQKESLDSIDDKISKLKNEIGLYKKDVKDFWLKINEHLKNKEDNLMPVGEYTERMFVAALKNMFRFSKKYFYFKNKAVYIKQALIHDSKRFNEKNMSIIIDFSVCIEWLNYLINQNLFCIKLLYKIKEKTSRIAQQLTPSRSLDLEENGETNDRFMKWDQDEWDTSEKAIRNQGEYLFGNDDEWLSQGFNWREVQNDPYLYGDPDEDIYPHYYNKDKRHRGVDK